MTGYTIKVVERARALKRAGWSSPKIARILEDELGVCPSATVIRLWCSTAANEKTRHAERERRRRAYREAHPRRANPRLSEDWKLERIRELYLRGVSYRAIGQVAAVWWGEELSAEQVKTRLDGRRGYKRKPKTVAHA